MARIARIVVAAAVLASACAVSHEPRLVSIPQPGVRTASRLEEIDNYRTAAVTIASISERHLGFPRFPVTFRFYPNRDAFEKALLASGYEAALARSTARTMMAVGGHRGVLLNDGKLGGLPWADRVGLLAHELAHTLQYELAGGVRGSSDQWLREGFAEWLSVRVLERLDAVSLHTVRRVRQLDLHAARSRVPPLRDLVTFPQWVRAGERHGAAIYALSFLAVDLLLERHGVARVIAYFERFASSQDRETNFRTAFGEDLGTFETVLNRRLSRR